MGMTPLEGLVMGTRSGDIDPAVLLHLQRGAGLDADAHRRRCSTRAAASSGSAATPTCATARGGREAGDDAATLAFDVYAHRIRSYVGAYAAQLGRVDAIVFTAGVGENSPIVRERSLAGLEGFGVEVDAERNGERSRVARRISTDDSRTAVLVVPTNEELEIARQTVVTVS